ncbi:MULTISPECIES: cellulase family glycosylhydrolase [Rhodomicrobium]|uniref:glycoside hydrolase family 5 protein n=1 Tax=Rhodomicrobium TaxID=1068 RepID=UPI001483BDD1|nr:MULTISPECIES: cellulase family glycosylhydrolase [Rhodomicrobium]
MRDGSRQLWLWVALLAVLAGAALMIKRPAAPVRDGAPFKMARAINIAQWFTWPRYEAAGAIAWPPFKETPRPPSLAELQDLRRVGFDTVRLPVDPAPFFVFTGERRKALHDILFEAIGRIRAAGLNVLVDIHPNSSHPIWGQDSVAAGFDTPAFLGLAAFAEDFARRVPPADRQSVALELVNEPKVKCKGADQALWQHMVKTLVRRVRAVNSGLALVVSGACGSSPDGLIALDPLPFHDPAIFYTFHFYEPFAFSHQGAQFIRWPEKYLDGVPWPAGARPISEPMALLEARLASIDKLVGIERSQAESGAAHNLKRFYQSGAGRGTIRARFAEIGAWAKTHGIDPKTILIGEFGVVRRLPGVPGAFCADRMRWLRDVRELAEAEGFAWAYFNYDGPFALVNAGDDRRLDPDVLESLGLNAECPQAQADPAACLQACDGNTGLDLVRSN